MAGFRKLTNTVSIKEEYGTTTFKINNEWTFEMPSWLDYYTDFNYDDETGVGGIDMAGSNKPLVLQGGYSGAKHLVNIAVAPHFDYTGQFYSVIDCKYDNSFEERTIGSMTIQMNTRKVIIDEPGFFVDACSKNFWPLYTAIKIRVRGDNITPFNLEQHIKDIDEYEWEKIKEVFIKIAESVKLCEKAAAGSKRSSSNISFNSDYIIEGDTLVKYIGRDTNIVIPAGVKEIANSVFSGYSNLVSVVLPEGLTSIGNRAFENCVSLENIEVPDSIEYIGGYAFVDCHKLKQINLGKKLKYLESSVFSECYELNNVKIPNGVKSVGPFVFKNCRAFTSIVIPKGCCEIGVSAFAYCKNLNYLYVPDTVTSIEEDFLNNSPFTGSDILTIHTPMGSVAYDYANSHNIRCVSDNDPIKVSGYTPASVTQNTVRRYDTTAMNSNYDDQPAFIIKKDRLKGIGNERKINWKDVTIPEGVKLIGRNAFQYNKKIEKVTIPSSVTKISPYAFSKCTSLIDVDFHEGIEKIGAGFCDCTQLERITLPASVKDIESAFCGCTSLKEVELKEGVKSIRFAFEKCTALREIILPSTVKDMLHAFKGCKSLEKITMTKKSGRKFYDDSIDTYGTFEECKSLRYAYLENVTRVGQNMFLNCKKLEEVTIPDTVSDIGAYAFKGCSKLKTITIPKSVEDIHVEAFSGCSSLNEIIVLGDNTRFSLLGSDFDGEKWTTKKIRTLSDILPTENEKLVIRCSATSKVREQAIEDGVKYDDIPQELKTVKKKSLVNNESQVGENEEKQPEVMVKAEPEEFAMPPKEPDKQPDDTAKTETISWDKLKEAIHINRNSFLDTKKFTYHCGPKNYFNLCHNDAMGQIRVGLAKDLSVEEWTALIATYKTEIENDREAESEKYCEEQAKIDNWTKYRTTWEDARKKELRKVENYVPEDTEESFFDRCDQIAKKKADSWSPLTEQEQLDYAEKISKESEIQKFSFNASHLFYDIKYEYKQKNNQPTSSVRKVGSALANITKNESRKTSKAVEKAPVKKAAKAPDVAKTVKAPEADKPERKKKGKGKIIAIIAAVAVVMIAMALIIGTTYKFWKFDPALSNTFSVNGLTCYCPEDWSTEISDDGNLASATFKDSDDMDAWKVVYYVEYLGEIYSRDELVEATDDYLDGEGTYEDVDITGCANAIKFEYNNADDQPIYLTSVRVDNCGFVFLGIAKSGAYYESEEFASMIEFSEFTNFSWSADPEEVYTGDLDYVDVHGLSCAVPDNWEPSDDNNKDQIEYSYNAHKTCIASWEVSYIGECDDLKTVFDDEDMSQKLMACGLSTDPEEYSSEEIDGCDEVLINSGNYVFLSGESCIVRCGNSVFVMVGSSETDYDYDYIYSELKAETKFGKYVSSAGKQEAAVKKQSADGSDEDRGGTHGTLGGWSPIE